MFCCVLLTKLMPSQKRGEEKNCLKDIPHRGVCWTKHRLRMTVRERERAGPKAVTAIALKVAKAKAPDAN